tara:strand:- start:2587 stop:3225 length:639 start_codon:yes stop_codon:yes gene_type:complete
MISIVTAGTGDFKIFYDHFKKSVTDKGYPLYTYDLGDLGEGKKFKGRVSHKINAKIPSKPSIIKDCMFNIKQNDYLVWMDADTLLIKNIDEIKQDYNMAVTLRPPRYMMLDNPANAGVLFFRKTQATLDFLDKWVGICENAESDQTELNKLIRLTNNDMGNTLLVEGMNVKVFSCQNYNNYFFNESQEGASILHFKTSLRKFHPAFANNNKK